MMKIGLVAPFEGAERALGYEALQGVKLALAERNADGGVDGYMIELVALDHSSQPQEARLQAEELAADPDVFGVIAGWSDDLARASLPEYRQRNLPVVVPWSVSSGLAKSQSGTVLVTADAEQVAGALAGLLSSRGYQQVLIAGDEERAESYVLVFNDARLPTEEAALPGVPNREAYGAWADLVASGNDHPPDAVVLVGDGFEVGEAVRALRESGWQGDVLGGAGAGCVQTVDVAGAAVDGLVYGSPAPAGQDLSFLAPFEPTLGAEELSPRGVAAYDATLTLLAAIETSVQREGHLTRERVARALLDVDIEGLTGRVVFDETGRRIDAPVWIYEIGDNGYPGLLREDGN